MRRTTTLLAVSLTAALATARCAENATAKTTNATNPQPPTAAQRVERSIFAYLRSTKPIQNEVPDAVLAPPPAA